MIKIFKHIEKQISLLTITGLIVSLFVAPAAQAISPAANSAVSQTASWATFADEKYQPTVTVEIDEEINLTSRSTSFESVESGTNFDFSSIALAWQDDISNGAHLDLEMRFNDKDWSRWYPVDAGIDYKDGDDMATKNAFMVTGNANAYQYRFTLGSEEPWAEASISNLKITYFNAEEAPANQKVEDNNYYINPPRSAKDMFLAFTGDYDLIVRRTRVTSSSSRGNLNIITRAQWGADEGLRVYKKPAKTEKKIEPKKTTSSAAAKKYEKYKNELKIVRTVTKNSRGQDLTWALQYPEKIKKIVIHHTATTDEAIVSSATRRSSNPNYRKVVNDIYRYHTISRAWGDIGYHYLIDPDGNIYEGRYGEAVGAHAAGYNTGSLGIAVIGNYENAQLPDKVLASLTQLVASKTKKYKISADGKTVFRGDRSHNILGHKNVSATVCPGKNLYSALPKLRRLVASSNNSSGSTNKPFAFDNVSDFYDLDVHLNETKSVSIKLKNVGLSTWGGGSYMALDENSKNKALFEFPGKSGVKFAYLKEKSVRPGRTGTFQFSIRSKGLSGFTELSMTPFIRASNRTVRMDHQVHLPVFVEEPIYTYEIVSQSLPPEIIKAGQLMNGYIDLKNTGNTTWSKTNPSIHLGTDRPRDRNSSFIRQKPFTRIGTLEQDEVKPNAVGRFKFTLKAPDQSGLYTEYFTPVISGVTWLPDKKMHFTSYVYDKAYEGLVTDISGDKEVSYNSDTYIKFNVKNVGGRNWIFTGPSALKFDSVTGQGVTVTKVDYSRSTVKPGQTMQVSVTLRGQSNVRNGRLTIVPMVAGTSIVKRPMIFSYRSVKKKSSRNTNIRRSPSRNYSNSRKAEPTVVSTPSEQLSTNNIRIKLGFDEKPVIKSEKGMDLYSNGQHMKTYPAGEEVKVVYSRGTYRMESSSRTKSSSKPPRFVAKSGGALEIVNWERRPTWNQSLNDNMFLGALEFKISSGMPTTINELPLEDYLKGLAENTESEDLEKMKALIVAARTYAKYYMTIGTKFPGKDWHLDDDPNVSQKYLGYGYQKRAPKTSTAVDATRDELITYKGQLIKTPYFSQSAGRTFSAKEVWGWNNTPYLQSVEDKYCDTTVMKGHGVGLSACGARGLAAAGKGYKEILKYFYIGVEIK